MLILPSGRPESALDDGAREAVREWVRAGGTLVAVGESAHWIGTEMAGIEARATGEDELTEEERTQRALRTMDEKRSDAQLDAVEGIILPARVDPAHPLAWGSGEGNEERRVFVLHFDGQVFEPTEDFTTVVSFEPGLEGVSGPISEEQLARLASSAWLAESRLGRGHIILFADDPLFRLMWRSSFQFFANALLLGPAM